MKVKMITAVLVVVVVVAVMLLADSSHAAYRPDKVFLVQMETLLERAPIMWYDDIPFRSIQVGKTYQEGDVAYFVLAGPASWMQLEEWRTGSDGNFHLTTWICGPTYAKTWTLVLSPEGQLMDDNKIVQRDFNMASPETINPEMLKTIIEKSEKIQKLLQKAGQQL